MRKYWAFCRVSLQNTLAYRGPIAVWLASNVLNLVGMVAVWFSASAGKTIAGYTKSELVTYYIAALLLQWLIGWFPFYGVKDEIKTGGIVFTALLKPVSYFWEKFAQDLGWHIVGASAGLVATLMVAFPLRHYLVFHLSLVNFSLLLVTTLLAILVVFSFSMGMGLLAFWFTETGAVDDLFWAARIILGGQGLPLSFIPGFFQMLVRILPFRYMFSFPLEIYFGKLTGEEMTRGIVMQLFWIVILLWIYRVMWVWGRRAYTAFGQ